MTSTRGMLWLLWLAVTCVWLAGRARGTVSCRTACAQCAARSEHQALLEVYCAMCHECRERRRAWRHFAPRRRKAALSPRPSHRANSADEFPDESPDGPPEEPPEEPRCPEPPPCDSELLEGAADKLMPTTPQRDPLPPPPLPQGPLPAPAPTPAQPCPVHAACQTAGGAPCCMPYCPYMQPCAAATQKLTMSLPTTASPTEYFYIHVGVPKDILNNM